MAVYYFWQNMAATHQVHCLRDLANRHQVHWLVDEEMDADRLSQGWSVPNFDKIRLRSVKPSDVDSILEAAPIDALHVFSPRGCATGPKLLRELERRTLKYAFLAEKPLNMGLALWLRGWIYRSLARRSRGRRFFLAMGENGASWYRGHGFLDAIPFAYSVAKSTNEIVAPMGSGYRLICVAQLIRRKNHRTLLRALAIVHGDWTLECIGRGGLNSELRTMARSLGIADRITWSETVSNDDVRTRIARSDSLVLVSAWEGWGAVVNEAIAEGTRVIVSEAAGAACLLGLSDIGHSVPAEDVAALADRLRQHMARGRVQPRERVIRRASHERIDGPAMARYFERIVAGNRPESPWFSA